MRQVIKGSDMQHESLLIFWFGWLGIFPFPDWLVWMAISVPILLPLLVWSVLRIEESGLYRAMRIARIFIAAFVLENSVRLVGCSFFKVCGGYSNPNEDDYIHLPDIVLIDIMLCRIAIAYLLYRRWR